MIRICVLPLTALTLSGIFSSGLELLEPVRMKEQALNKIVGVVDGKCCLPGRRWGCDPQNFSQSGCTRILRPLNCQGRRWMTMKCTSASCVPSNPEHKCEVDIRTVRHNQCRPTGHSTTVGCPEEQWQCEVNMRGYTNSANPSSDKLVCDDDIATLCGNNYSACD